MFVCKIKGNHFQDGTFHNIIFHSTRPALFQSAHFMLQVDTPVFFITQDDCCDKSEHLDIALSYSHLIKVEH
jgi:hypothetical protein